MTDITQPLHVAIIRGHQLRFYRTPNNDGRPDLPWHCCDDLYHCMGLPRGVRKHFQQQMKRGPFAGDFRMVATSDGIITIAPHYVAQSIAAMWHELECADIENEYAREGAAAIKKLAAHLVFPDQVLPWLKAAMNRHEDEGTQDDD
jgi:hypothetical protein